LNDRDHNRRLYAAGLFVSRLPSKNVVCAIVAFAHRRACSHEVVMAIQTDDATSLQAVN
jgi:hypothetical protein